MGETVTVPITLDTVGTNGLIGAEFTVTLSDATVADITGYTKPAWAGLVTTDPATITTASTVTIRLIDLTGTAVALDATNVDLGTLTLTAKAAGTTSIVVTPTAALGLQDRAGNIITASSTDGTLTVAPITTVTTVVTTPPTTVVTTEVTTPPTTVVTTEVTTQPTTVVTTEVTTQPTTVVTTEVTTEPTTVVTTEVTTEPTTVVTTEVTTEPTTVVTTEVTTTVPTTTVTVPPTGETPGPYPGPHVPTARIEAEDFDQGGEGVAYHDVEPANLGGAYRPDEGVDIEVGASNFDVGWIRAGEYLKYSIDTTAAGSFDLVLHAANPDTTAKAVKVYLDGVPATEVLISGTGGWTTYRDFTASSAFNIPAGRHTVTLSFEGVERINLDWLSLTAGIPTTTTTAVPTPQTTPYGPGNNVPGRVQAENFDKNGVGAQNAAYYDTTLANEGGAYRPSESVDIEYMTSISSYDVGWIRTGEYLIYTVQVSNAGTYIAQFNAANPDASSKAIDISVDGNKVGTVQIGTTGSFDTFKKFDFSITLPAGKHQLKLAFPSERLNLDYIEFANGNAVTGGSFVAAPTTATFGSAVKFVVTPATGKTIKAAWWSFDATNHLQTWNSRMINPTFFYPQKGTFSPLVELTYTDGSTQTIRMDNYIHAT